MKQWFYILFLEYKVASITGVLIILSIIFESFGFGLIFPLLQGILGQEKNGFFFEAVSSFLGIFGLNADLQSIIIILCIMVTIKTVLNILREMMKSFLGYNFKQKTIATINSYIFNRPYSEIISEQHGSWFNRIVVETQSSSMGLIQLVEVIISILYIIMLSVVLFLTDPYLTVKAMCLAGVFFIGVYALMNGYAKRTGLLEVTLNRELNSQISENISLNKEYRVSQTVNQAITKVKKTALKLRNLLVTWDAVSGSIAPIIELFLVISFCAIILFTASQSPDEMAALVSTLALFAVVGLRILQRAARLSSSIMSVRKYTASLNVILPYIQAKPTQQTVSPQFPGGDIACRKLTIRDRDGNSILADVDLDINEKSIVAIVGPSGSGKTSLIETLLGLRIGFEGDVTYNDVNIKSLDPNSILENVSLVSQNIDLFNISLKENIQGKNNLTDKEVISLGQSLRINTFISKLDDGYDTVVGERGNMLSGGQKQRVLIARALNYDAPYLILDEPTSALDADLESHIFDLIQSLKDRKTIIIITHRPKLLELADSIYDIVDQKLVKRD